VIRIKWMGDGEIFSGQTFADVVDMLRSSARLGVDEDVLTYMGSVSRRLKEWNGAVIRTDSCEGFIRDLEENGFIIILEGE
jgi:hypothetical protein